MVQRRQKITERNELIIEYFLYLSLPEGATTRTIQLRQQSWCRPSTRLAAEGPFKLLAQKLVFHNSDLDKSATVWVRELLKQWAIYLRSSL